MDSRVKACGLLIVLIVQLCVQAESVLTGGCECVRERLSILEHQMGNAFPEYRQIIEDADGLGLSSNATFLTMSQLITENWTNVLAGLDAISTNLNERLIVLYAGVGVGETNFLARIDCLADMALSNRVSLSELRFYKTQCSIVDHYAASSLVRRYQEPAISNLIMKLDAAGLYPRGVSDILSGEAKLLYEDAVREGLIQ